MSLWRPLCPPGYARLGDVAQTGYDPPRSPVAVYLRTDPALAPPTGYSLVWRDTGSGATERVTLWAPTPPPGFAALGCLAVAGDAQPEVDAVRCVALERVRWPPLFSRDASLHGSCAHVVWPFFLSDLRLAGV